jgi:hypothetical protein
MHGWLDLQCDRPVVLLPGLPTHLFDELTEEIARDDI